MTIPNTSAAVIIAAEAAQQQEEEELTQYSEDDFQEEWEFKILRSNFYSIGSTKALPKICQEEALAGWILVEKFDDYRLRFKRPMKARENDGNLNFDPYRTWVSPFSDDTFPFSALIFAIVMLSLIFLFIIF